jgi:hypothetical protein
MTMQEQSVGADGTAMETKEDKLLQAVKRFQQSETVQSHPEILSGKGAFDARTAEDAQNLVRKHRNRRALLGAEKAELAASETLKYVGQHVSNRASRPRRLHNKQYEHRIEKELKSPLTRFTSSDSSRYSKRVKVQAASIALLNTSAPNTNDQDAETVSFGDDDYSQNFDPTKLVFQQCNIIAYWYSEGRILDYCGKCRPLFEQFADSNIPLCSVFSSSIYLSVCLLSVCLSVCLPVSIQTDEFDVILGLVYYSSEGEYDNGKIFKLAEVSLFLRFAVRSCYQSLSLSLHLRLYGHIECG